MSRTKDIAKIFGPTIFYEGFEGDYDPDRDDEPSSDADLTPEELKKVNGLIELGIAKDIAIKAVMKFRSLDLSDYVAQKAIFKKGGKAGAKVEKVFRGKNYEIAREREKRQGSKRGPDSHNWSNVEWIAAIDGHTDEVADLITTNSEDIFWKAFHKLATGMGDTDLADDIMLRDNPDKKYMQGVADKFREDAKEFAEMRVNTTSKKFQRGPGTLYKGSRGMAKLAKYFSDPKPDRLGWTKEQTDEYYEKRRKERGNEVRISQITGKPVNKRKYKTEHIYRLYDPALNKAVTDEHGNEIESESYDDLEATALEFSDIFTNPGEFEIKEVKTKLNISLLKDMGDGQPMKKPLEHGYTVIEIINAMAPYIKYWANEFKTNDMSPDDLFQEGVLALIGDPTPNNQGKVFRGAIETDKGDNAFINHAGRYIKRRIQRAAQGGGLVKSNPESFGTGETRKATRAASRELGASTGASWGRGAVLQGHDVIWYKKDAEGKVDKGSVGKRHFPADPSEHDENARKKKLEKGEKTVKQQMAEFRKQKAKEGYMVAVKNLTGKLVSTSTPTGGKGDSEGGGELGSLLPSNQYKKAPYVVGTTDEMQHVINKAGLTPDEKMILNMAFGLDDPAFSIGTANPEVGADIKDPKPGAKQVTPTKPFKMGAGEDPMAIALQQYKGMKPKKTAMATALQQYKGMKPKDDIIDIERGPVEIADILSMSETTVRKKIKKAIEKMRLAYIKYLEKQLKDEKSWKAEREVDRRVEAWRRKILRQKIHGISESKVTEHKILVDTVNMCRKMQRAASDMLDDHVDLIKEGKVSFMKTSTQNIAIIENYFKYCVLLSLKTGAINECFHKGINRLGIILGV